MESLHGTPPVPPELIGHEGNAEIAVVFRVTLFCEIKFGPFGVQACQALPGRDLAPVLGFDSQKSGSSCSAGSIAARDWPWCPLRIQTSGQRGGMGLPPRAEDSASDKMTTHLSPQKCRFLATRSHISSLFQKKVLTTSTPPVLETTSKTLAAAKNIGRNACRRRLSREPRMFLWRFSPGFGKLAHLRASRRLRGSACPVLDARESRWRSFAHPTIPDVRLVRPPWFRGA